MLVYHDMPKRITPYKLAYHDYHDMSFCIRRCVNVYYKMNRYFYVEWYFKLRPVHKFTFAQVNPSL